MKRKVNIKSKLAGMLAAVMVFTMAAPASPVYAVDYGHEVEMRFDPQNGPGMSYTSYSTVAGEAGAMDGDVFVAKGLAGHPLTSSDSFTGIGTDDFGSGPRPKIPSFKVEWKGYTFDGWYDSQGNKVLKLPYAFQYEPKTTYKAVWTGNESVPYNFTVRHYRDFNGGGWPEDDGDTNIRKFYESSWTSSQMANTPISATYRRDIPGYQFDSVLIKNNKPLKYGEQSGMGTMDGGASINESTHAVRGSMPNDNLTVAYRYKPDTSKKFPITVRYEDMDGTQIKPPEIKTFPVEAPYDIAPPDITSYEVKSGTLTDGGTTNLDGAGVVSAEAAGCSIDPATFHFTGSMPNQGITFTYKYDIKSDFKIYLKVNRKDNHGKPLMDQEVREVPANISAEVAVNNLPGYSYPPNVTWKGALTGGVFDKDGNKLTVTPGLQGGTVDIVYNEDISDENYWAKVEFYNGKNGSFEGDPSPRFFKKSENTTLAQATDGLTPKAAGHYRFDGWYLANSNGSDKTGSKLADEYVIKTSQKLFANFEEQDGHWFDLKFVAGSHGSISGSTTVHTVIDTLWTDLTLPVPHADNAYTFAGWFDQNGNKVQNTQTIQANQTYEARFIPTSLPDDGILAMPDAYGSVSAAGSGTISVAGANESRRYALTDGSHAVKETKLGSQLKKGSFTGLNPCESYYVYELALTASPAPGTVLPDGVDPGSSGPPTRVTVPALGSNYQVKDDTGGTMKIVVNPANAGTMYALLNMDGDTVKVPASDGDGWVTPGGSPLSAVFGKLDANQLYIVVAKQPAETAAPADKRLLGTQVAVVGNPQAQQEYTFALTNGSVITEIKRNGNTVDFDNPESAVVKAGDVISFEAKVENDEGQGFKEWSSLIGRLPQDIKNRRNPKITMPDENLVLQPNYYSAAPATPGNAAAAVDYTPKSGSVGLDLSDDNMSYLLNELTGESAGDQTAMAAGIDVLYTIKFNKRVPKASESDAVKEAAEDETVKVPWALASTLARQVGGSNKDIPEGVNQTPDINVYSELDRSMQGYIDYKLWNVSELDGELNASEVTITPDPGDEDSGFTGVVSFKGQVGSTYVLTYLKSHEVTIIDDKRAVSHTVKVKTDTALEDADGFVDLGIFADFTDPVTGIVWEYKGLGKTAASTNEYDISAPVTKNLTLHVLYSMADDSEWRAAMKKLKDQIARAQALAGNTSVSEENKQALNDAIAIALEVANREYRPTVDELIETHDTLKALVDSISSGGGENPDNPGGDPDHPDNPDNPGGGGSGGGGGGGGSSRGSGATGRGAGPGFSFNSYRTYGDGAEGQWETVGTDPNKWAFVLKNGRKAANEWANVRYGDARQTCTYHFNAEGVMDYGWYMDDQGQWYYLNEVPGPDFGRLIVGWHFDAKAQKWYYLNQFTGGMATGWQKMGDDWYFFNPVTLAGRPMGALYTSEITPDGYSVDENGKWMRETP